MSSTRVSEVEDHDLARSTTKVKLRHWEELDLNEKCVCFYKEKLLEMDEAHNFEIESSYIDSTI